MATTFRERLGETWAEVADTTQYPAATRAISDDCLAIVEESVGEGTSVEKFECAAGAALDLAIDCLQFAQLLGRVAVENPNDE